MPFTLSDEQKQLLNNDIYNPSVYPVMETKYGRTRGIDLFTHTALQFAGDPRINCLDRAFLEALDFLEVRKLTIDQLNK